MVKENKYEIDRHIKKNEFLIGSNFGLLGCNFYTFTWGCIQIIYRFQWLFGKPIKLLAGIIKRGTNGIYSLYDKKKETDRKNEIFSNETLAIDEMSGIDFEEFLEILFRKKGYNVKTTATTGDYGADLILSRYNRVIVVQAKRYSGSIGVKAVQEVIGAKGYYKADNGMVVTNSYFTPNAVNLAVANHIELWDRERLTEEIKITKAMEG